MRTATASRTGGLAVMLLIASAPAAAQVGANNPPPKAPSADAAGTLPTGYRNSFQCIPDSAETRTKSFQIISAGKDPQPAQPAPRTDCEAAGPSAGAPAPGALIRETEPLNVGMVVPVVQSARGYAPPKKPEPRPEPPRDDCMSCDD